MEETQLWYCDICDNTTIIKSNSKHINSETHIHKQECGFVVKESEFINPDIDELNYKLIDTIKDCRQKYFHSIENGCAHDIKIISLANNAEVDLPLFIGYMKIKSQFYGLNKKIKTARNFGFIVIEIVKLAVKNFSSLPNINMCYYLKLRIPMYHKQF